MKELLVSQETPEDPVYLELKVCLETVTVIPEDQELKAW